MSNKQPTTIEELILGSMAGIEQGWLRNIVFDYCDCGGEVRICIERFDERNYYRTEED